MIQFNFKVSDVDAENIMGCLQSEINKCLEHASEALADDHQAEYKWFLKRIEYIESLKKKMSNIYVQDESTIEE